MSRPSLRNLTGRGERIRTSGPYVPNVVLYQAELLPDTGDLTDPVVYKAFAHYFRPSINL